MAERVILHIGPRKTGTTYVQQVLWGNQDRLAEQGVMMPLDDNAQQLVALAPPASPYRGPRTAERLQQLVDQVEAHPGTALISTELLGTVGQPNLATMFERLPVDPATQVDVVFGVRDLSRQIPAEWQQWVRARSSISFEGWLERLRSQDDHPFWWAQLPQLIVPRWAKFVADDRVHAVLVPPSGSDPHELWRRFAAATGIDPEGFTFPEGKVNESMGLVQADLLRRVNRALGQDLPRPGPYQHGVNKALIQPVLLGADRAVPIRVPAEHASWLRERQQQIVEFLAQRSDGVWGDPAELLDTMRFSDAPPPTDRDVADEAVRVIAELLRRREDERRQRLAATDPAPAAAGGSDPAPAGDGLPERLGRGLEKVRRRARALRPSR